MIHTFYRIITKMIVMSNLGLKIKVQIKMLINNNYKVGEAKSC